MHCMQGDWKVAQNGITLKLLINNLILITAMFFGSIA